MSKLNKNDVLICTSIMLLIIPVLIPNSIETSNKLQIQYETIREGNFQPASNIAFHNNYIVYATEEDTSDIFLYDIKTRIETRITHDSIYQENPIIFGNYIVWEDESSHETKLILYNIKTKEERMISLGYSAIMYNNIIVYRNQDINIYHIDTDEIEHNSEIAPGDIYENLVVFSDFVGPWSGYEDNFDIKMFNIDTKEKKIISDEKEMESDAVIYDNYICWKNYGNNGLYVYDILRNKTKRICEYGEKPEIYQNYIVFKDYINPNGDEGISLYDFRKDETYIITTEDKNEMHDKPIIYKNHIIWLEYSGQNVKLVLATFSLEKIIFGINQSLFYALILIIFGIILLLSMLIYIGKKKKNKKERNRHISNTMSSTGIQFTTDFQCRTCNKVFKPPPGARNRTCPRCGSKGKI